MQRTLPGTTPVTILIRMAAQMLGNALFSFVQITSWASEIDQQANMPSSRPDSPSSIPRTHMVEGGNQSLHTVTKDPRLFSSSQPSIPPVQGPIEMMCLSEYSSGLAYTRPQTPSPELHTKWVCLCPSIRTWK